ncbi:MAG: endoglucanase [Methanobrevibacter sp.]|jgi:hypothetical protein|nr:endoglucanase [Methanobrevibacter sp.]
MRNTNLIIAIIIVLCIAAGVTAYGIINPDNSIINLPGYTPDTGSTGSDSGDAGKTTTDTGTGGSSSGSGSGSNGGNNGGSGGGSSVVTHDGMTNTKAKEIATNAIEEPGAYAGTPYWDAEDHLWIVPVLDKNGNQVDGIGVDPKTGSTSRV